MLNPILLKECYAKNESAKSAKEIVMEFIGALERKDFKTVRSYINDNISVLAPGPVELTTFNSAEPFTTYLEHANLPKLEIKKEFADSNDVYLLYEMNYHEPPVTTFVCGWFHVNDDGKISSLRFILDKTFVPAQKIGRDLQNLIIILDSTHSSLVEVYRTRIDRGRRPINRRWNAFVPTGKIQSSIRIGGSIVAFGLP